VLCAVDNVTAAEVRTHQLVHHECLSATIQMTTVTKVFTGATSHKIENCKGFETMCDEKLIIQIAS